MADTYLQTLQTRERMHIRLTSIDLLAGDLGPWQQPGVPQSRTGLARPVRAEEAGHRPGADGEAEVVDGGRPAVALGQFLSLDHDCSWLEYQGFGLRK
jgi:hypothetical protein